MYNQVRGSVRSVSSSCIFLGRDSGGCFSHGGSIASIIVDSSRCLCDRGIASIMFICDPPRENRGKGERTGTLK